MYVGAIEPWDTLVLDPGGNGVLEHLTVTPPMLGDEPLMRFLRQRCVGVVRRRPPDA